MRMKTMSEVLEILTVTLALTVINPPGAAVAAPIDNPDEWPYLPQCHKCADPVIFERNALDTTSATVFVRVTRKSAADYCANFAPGEDLEVCMALVLAKEKDRTYTASADCAAGKLVADDGSRYEVSGIWIDGLAAGRVRFVDAAGESVMVGLHLLGLPLSTQWQVLCPSVEPVLDDEFQPRQAPFGDHKSIVGINHNGSGMWVSQDLSVIYYDKPKASIAGTVSPGTVLYRGDPITTFSGQVVTGLAHTFRKGCEPAPYPVTGGVARDGSLVLRGAAPIREQNGCKVIGYTEDSGNATLVFTFSHGDI